MPEKDRPGQQHPGRRPRPGAGQNDQGMGPCVGPECNKGLNQPPGRGLGQGGKGRGMGPGKGQGCDKPDHTGKKD